MAALVAVASAADDGRSTGQSSTFRTNADIVRLEVTVLDEQRRPVRGLKPENFTIREDGRERPTAVFTVVDLPQPPSFARTETVQATWADVPDDVTRNSDAEEGRLVVIAFDWSIRFHEQAAARRIAMAAVDALGPGDQAAVIFTNRTSESGRPQNFTADRALLRRAIDQPFATAAIADVRARGNANGVQIDDPEGYESGECLCRVCSLDSLTRVADSLRTVSSRPKVVLLIATHVRLVEALRGPMEPSQ